ncbi:hypothetical protein D3C87_1402250 [compost metagenome]
MPISEIGRDTVGISVAAARRRNRKITSTTSATVSASVNCTSWIDSRMERERSFTTFTLTEPGICWIRRGRAALMASTTATVLASGWRSTASTMERSLLSQLPVLRVSTLSSTSATSESRTTAPLGWLATMMLRNASALVICRLAWMVSVWRAPSSVPTGVLALARFSAVASSSSVSPRAASASGWARTRTEKRFWPKTCTCATPGRVASVGEIRLSPNAFSSARLMAGELIASSSTGASAGFTLR